MLYTTVTQNTIFVRCHAFNLHVPFFFGIEGDIIHKPQIILLHNSLALSLLKKKPFTQRQQLFHHTRRVIKYNITFNSCEETPTLAKVFTHVTSHKICSIAELSKVLERLPQLVSWDFITRFLKEGKDFITRLREKVYEQI